MADVGLGKTPRTTGKRLDNADDRLLGPEWHSHHGTSTELAADIRVYARVNLSIIAAYRAAAGKAGSGEAIIGIYLGTLVRRNGSGNRAANDTTIFRQRDSNAVGMRDFERTLCHKLQDFIEGEAIFSASICLLCRRIRIRRFPLVAHLLLQRRKGEECLKSVSSRGLILLSRGLPGCRVRQRAEVSQRFVGARIHKTKSGMQLACSL